MADTANEAATELPGDKAERPSLALAMVNDALSKLNAERRKRTPDAPDLTIAELERLNGFAKGALASPLKPANRSRVPRQPTIRNLADALNINAAKLGHAFMADYMGDGDEVTVHQQRAVDLIAELPAPLQRLGLRQLEALVEHHRATERACEAVILAADAGDPTG